MTKNHDNCFCSRFPTPSRFFASSWPLLLSLMLPPSLRARFVKAFCLVLMQKLCLILWKIFVDIFNTFSFCSFLNFSSSLVAYFVAKFAICKLQFVVVLLFCFSFLCSFSLFLLPDNSTLGSDSALQLLSPSHSCPAFKVNIIWFFFSLFFLSCSLSKSFFFVLFSWSFFKLLSIALMVWLCGLHSNNVCAIADAIPNRLFFQVNNQYVIIVIQHHSQAAKGSSWL